MEFYEPIRFGAQPETPLTPENVTKVTPNLLPKEKGPIDPTAKKINLLPTDKGTLPEIASEGKVSIDIDAEIEKKKREELYKAQLEIEDKVIADTNRAVEEGVDQAA